MNRDILFRAKRVDNGKWVEGYYTYHPYGFTVEDKFYHDITDTSISEDYNMLYFVDPSTICRYTGLNDNDGNKFWENDIVSYEDAIGVIRYGEFNSKYIGFYIEWLGKCHDLRNDPLFWIPKVKIIGNIFDRPELLKAGTHD